MKNCLVQNGGLYVLAILLALGLKFHYSTAESVGLLWILGPTAWLVSLLTNLEFAFIPAEGFISTTGGIVIAPACAGVNFLIICFCMLAFSHLHRFRSRAEKMGWLFVSGLSALIFTLLVNAARIGLSIHGDVLPGPAGLLSPERIHRLEGISLYFLALSLLYYASEVLLTRLEKARLPETKETRSSPVSFLVPLFWYLAVTLGVPLARGSFGGDFSQSVEHGLTVILIPGLLLITISAFRALVSRFLRTSHFRQAGGFGLVLLAVAAFSVWNPGPVTTTSFNTDQNGLWVESKWYTGFDGTTGEPVRAAEIDAFAKLLATNRIRFVYVRAGRIAPSGEVEHMPGPKFFELKKRSPEVVFLPWLSGHAEELPLQNPEWRNRAIQSMGKLYALGVKGVHLDIEPIRNNQPGYVNLLKGIRDRFDGAFFVSHAACRVAPIGLAGTVMSRYFWSAEFYKATMKAADQTVLMGYNTALRSRKLYVAYLKRQTRMLLEWASEVPNHQVLIGIPSYDRVPFLFDPLVENIVTASQGVRAALEELAMIPVSFKGVAIYANWTTNPAEWRQFQETWLLDSKLPIMISDRNRRFDTPKMIVYTGTKKGKFSTARREIPKNHPRGGMASCGILSSESCSSSEAPPEIWH